MASINKVILVGSLGKDPETRFTASGQAVCNFSMATSEKFKDKSGASQERTEWHNIQAWGKLAEICGEYLSKGKLVYIEGRIQTRKWQDKDGNARYTTEIIADKMQMLGGKSERRDTGSTPAGSGGGYEEPPFSDDDIPFN